MRVSNQNKTVWLFIGVVVLALIYWGVSRRPWAKGLTADSEFNIKDTGEITKIFLANKRGGKILLERRPNNAWILNNSVQVDKDKIDLLLQTVHDMRMRNPVEPSLHNTVIAQLASNGIKAEFYEGDACVKTIYVGSATPDQTASYMLIENAEKAYAVHIPGFVGFLKPRFIMQPLAWRSKAVFQEAPETIDSLAVVYPNQPEASFLIAHQQVFDNHGQLVQTQANAVKQYLAGYHSLFVEGFPDAYTPHQVDSIRHLKPWCSIRLKRIDGTSTVLDVYLKAPDLHTKELYTEKDEVMKIDPEKYFAFINHEPVLALIQQYNFGRVFVGLQDLKH